MADTVAHRAGTYAAGLGMGSTERRQLRRSKIFTPVSLDDGKRTVRAHLLDIGSGGALCFTEDAPRRGTIVDIAWSSKRWAAEVVWIGKRRFGVRFLSPLPAAIVDSVIDNPDD